MHEASDVRHACLLSAALRSVRHSSYQMSFLKHLKEVNAAYPQYEATYGPRLGSAMSKGKAQSLLLSTATENNEVPVPLPLTGSKLLAQLSSAAFVQSKASIDRVAGCSTTEQEQR